MSPEFAAKLSRINAIAENRRRLARVRAAVARIEAELEHGLAQHRRAHQSAAASIAARRGSSRRSAGCASIWTNWRPS